MGTARLIIGHRVLILVLLLAASLFQLGAGSGLPTNGGGALRRLAPSKVWERISRVIVPPAGAAESGSSSSGSADASKKKQQQAAVPAPTTAQLFVTGMLSGAIAGMSVDLTLFPLDTVKTRLQAASKPPLGAKLFEGMYDGVGPALVASAPACAAFFGAYDTLKRYLAQHIASAPLVNLLAAAGGDLTQSVVRVPFEVVKQRLQAGVDKTWQEAVQSILSTRGPRGFYTGWGALALRDLPFDIIEFPLYEALKDVWSKQKGGEPLEPWESSFCGSLAGGIAAGLTTPLDVVKTRLMTQKAGSGAAQYKGLVDCLVRVAREEGTGALFKGIGPRVINIALGGAIFFGAYEAARKVVEPAVLDPAALQHRLDGWWGDMRDKAHRMKSMQMQRGQAAAALAAHQAHQQQQK